MTDRLRLLVVDDDLVDRLAIRRSVEQSGLDASINEASDSHEAAAKLDALARDKKNGAANDRATLFDQAGNAWLLASHPDQANDSFTAGLALSPADSDLLT